MCTAVSAASTSWKNQEREGEYYKLWTGPLELWIAKSAIQFDILVGKLVGQNGRPYITAIVSHSHGLMYEVMYCQALASLTVAS